MSASDPDSSARPRGLLQGLRGSGPPLILDGPMGTELERRGVATRLPLWSVHGLLEAPKVVRSIHREYVEAGAEVVTTNTFRTHARSLAKGGLGDRAGELTRLAVELAREAAAGAPSRTWIAGSISPLEDCYSPELTPPEQELVAEHRQMAERLAGGGVDLLLVETMPTIREAVVATRAAVATGLPVVTGLVCDTRGRLLSGEAVREAAGRLESTGVAALAINCTPTHALHVALEELTAATALPLGAYGNVGHAEAEVGWQRTDAISPGGYVRYTERWLALGVRLIGGCCGTTPAHTRFLAERIASRELQGDGGHPPAGG